MNPWLVRFCELVMQLNRIPRYGRYYTLRSESIEKGDIETGPAHWRYTRNGRWGMNLLDRMGLFWRYLDHLDPMPRVDLNEIGDDGLLVHMPMPINAYGEGPASEDVAVATICWCDAGANCPAIELFPKTPE